MNLTKYKKQLSLSKSGEYGPFLRLEDWDCRDYVEDVLCEHFEIEYEYMKEDEFTGENILYFGVEGDVDLINKALSEINEYHKNNEELYEVV